MPTSRSCGAKKSAKTAMIDSDRKAPLFDLAAKRVYVAGHNGMVGAAIVRRLKSEPCQILTTDRATP
jgi:NAD dependent epimerase/dehydratase family